MTPLRILLLRLLMLLACIAAPAHAQTYVPDSSAAAQAAYPWLDISATGTTLALDDDDVSGAINIGFTFTYGGTDYTQLRVASNGMLQFGGTSDEYDNSQLPLTGSSGEPNINAVMLPLWDDLNPGGDGDLIRYRMQGTAPNRVFIVSWLAVPYYCSNSGAHCHPTRDQTRLTSATFQVQLHEQGQFVFSYQDVDGAGGTHSAGAVYSNPAGATIGYELTNSDFDQFSYQSASVPSGTTILWSRPVTGPGSFDAFETSTPAGSIAGVIKTKVAGSAFTLAVVALNSTKTALDTTFTGDVKVELIDTADNSGAVDASTGCRSSWTSVLSTSTVNYVAGDAGRDNVGLTENNAWRDLRLRISYPATGTATVVACSSDNFAVRPSAFANFSVSDTDWQSAGTARSLANTGASGGNVHKAGRPFTVRATAVNAASATAGNYTGTPTATVSACAGTACTATFGTLTVSLPAVAGAIDDGAATYSEVGAFSLQLADADFASVDAPDSSVAERTISSAVLTVGRFVPDHFDVALLVTPTLKTFNSTSCAARSFTYVGQPFGYTTAPQATVQARNASGATTALYAGALWKLAGSGVAQTYSPLAPASPGLDVSAATAPSVTSNSNGTGVLATATTDTLSFVRSATTPLDPFDASISLTWSVSDGSESAVAGNGTIATASPLVFPSIAFDAGAAFRYGVLKLASAYGNELVNLAVGMQALYWSGNRFEAHAADHCTTLSTGIVAMGNYQRNLAACETALAPATLQLASGRGFFTLLKPGAGNNGSADVSLQLGATASGQTCTAIGGAPVAATAANLPWLQGKWSGATNYDRNPSARASFGQYRSPLIYLRERF
ncbi:DUF6701 domain-containing protein [Piscinibacter sp.]|uniref:DUF6701 domain-containing protein n=1 Tax=Piscinibacter sp. TaxID=1903157 RepID=UPI002C5FF354|nr:DUF6701 domain-containing protein [Albitalea sp.]HUG22115.1 DUF6701 domain-containing protein [Albitalea sp.]